MVTLDDPNLIIGIVGISLTILTFYVTYKQTIGATKERKTAAHRDLVSSVSRLIANDQLDVNPDIIQALIRSKAREYNINLDNMPNPIAIFEDSMTKFIENEFMSQVTKRELINRVLTIQQSYLDTAKIAEESKEEGMPFEILISTIAALITGILTISLSKSLSTTTVITTNIILFIIIIIVVVSGLTIILYFKIIEDRKKKSSEDILYSGKEFENLVFSTIVKYINERGSVKRNYSIISEKGRKWEIDLLIELGDKKIPVEIKYRKDDVSIDTVYQLISYKEILGAQKAVIITNTEITSDAKNLAAKNNIIAIEKVRNEADIINILNMDSII